MNTDEKTDYILGLADVYADSYRTAGPGFQALHTRRNLYDAIEALVADAERLDWLQKAADARKVELAQSIYKTGYEIGEWPSLRVTVKSGSLRDAIDAARSKA